MLLTRCIPLAMLASLLQSPACLSAADDRTKPAVRTFGRGAVIDGTVYLFGGGASIDIFTPNDGKWKQIATDEPSSNTLYGDAIDGKLYLLDVHTRRLVSFDPKTERFVALRSIPLQRINSTVIAAGGKLYVIGGYTEKVTEKNSVAVYDPKEDNWSDGPPLPGFEPLDHFHCAAMLDGKLHVVGGLLKDNKDQPHHRLDGDRWTRLADAPLHAMWKHAAVVAAEGQLYLLNPTATLPNNRNNPDKDAANFYRYDPKADKWHAIGRAPKDMPFVHFIPAAIGHRICFFGGFTARGPARPTRIFDVKTDRWE